MFCLAHSSSCLTSSPPAQPRQGYSNPLALLVAPLAGIALLTAAAAVAINPVLVTVSVTGKRRKRRDLDTVIGGQGEGISPELEEKIHEMQVLEKFMSSVPENTNYQQQVCNTVTTITIFTYFPLILSHIFQNFPKCLP